MESRARLGVVKLIMQYDDDASVDEDGDGIPDEVDLLAGTMSDASVYTDRARRSLLVRDRWKRWGLYYMHNVLLLAFQSYSEAAYAGGDDLDFMTMNGWTGCHECDLADAKSKYCRRSDLDMIFKQIDMLASRTTPSKRPLRASRGKAAVSTPTPVRRTHSDALNLSQRWLSLRSTSTSEVVHLRTSARP